MKWWLLKRRLCFRLNHIQKKAILGEIPRTKELFLSCVDTLFQRHEIEKFWVIWNKYPKYVRQWCNAYERGMAEPNSQRHKEAEDWWEEVKIKLVNAFGEDWVKENCIDMVEENERKTV